MRKPPITALRLPRGVRSVMVFGGTFDPPHLYHTVGPLIALKRMLPERSWLLYVPAAKNPLKRSGPVANDEDRLAMLRLALDIPGRRSVWTDELDRAAWLRDRGERRPSFTIDTLRRLRRALPRPVPIRLLIGADQAASFHLWRDARAILRIATPAIMPREPIVRVSSLYSALARTNAWTHQELAQWCQWMAPTIELPAASTDLRAAIAAAPRTAAAWARRPPLNQVTTEVAQYIIDHRLYGHPGPRAAAHPKAARPARPPRT